MQRGGLVQSVLPAIGKEIMREKQQVHSGGISEENPLVTEAPVGDPGRDERLVSRGGTSCKALPTWTKFASDFRRAESSERDFGMSTGTGEVSGGA